MRNTIAVVGGREHRVGNRGALLCLTSDTPFHPPLDSDVLFQKKPCEESCLLVKSGGKKNLYAAAADVDYDSLSIHHGRDVSRCSKRHSEALFKKQNKKQS